MQSFSVYGLCKFTSSGVHDKQGKNRFFHCLFVVGSLLSKLGWRIGWWRMWKISVTGTSSLCKVVDSKAQMYQSDSELVALHPVLEDPSCSPFRQDGVLAFYCLHCWVKRWQFTFCIFRKKKSMGGFPFRSIDQAAFLNGLSRGSRAKPLPKGAWIKSFAKLLGLAGNSSGSLFSLYIVNCTEERHHSNIGADEVCRQIWANFDNNGFNKMPSPWWCLQETSFVPSLWHLRVSQSGRCLPVW